MRAFAALLVCAISLAYARVSAVEDLSGKWTGAFVSTRPNGSVANETILMDLKQKGTGLSGTAGPTAEQQFPITTGTVDGNKVTLEVNSADGLVIKFSLVFAEGHLKGDAVTEVRGQKMTAKVDVQRKPATGVPRLGRRLMSTPSSRRR